MFFIPFWSLFRTLWDLSKWLESHVIGPGCAAHQPHGLLQGLLSAGEDLDGCAARTTCDEKSRNSFESLWNSVEKLKKNTQKELKRVLLVLFFSSPLCRGALWPLISFYAELQGSELLDAVHWRFVCEVSKSISKRKDKKYLTKILSIIYVYICLHMFTSYLC